MSLPFKPSDKVVCVDVGPNKNPRSPFCGKLPRQLELNQVYVVTDCWQTPVGTAICLVVGVQIEPATYNGHPTGFNCRRFRKLTDIQASNRHKRAVLQDIADKHLKHES